MSTQIATMSDSYSSLARIASFIVKLVVLVSFVAGIVALMALFDFYQTNLSQLMMMLFAIISISLAAGLGTRVVFYEFSGFVRSLMVLLLLPLGLFAIGLFTKWRMGIGPFEPWLRGNVDWFQLAQLSGGFFIAFLALWAWRKPVEVEEPEEMLPRVRRSSARKGQARAAASSEPARFKIPQINLNPPRLHLPESWTQPRGNSRSRANHRTNSHGRRKRGADKLVVQRPASPVRPKRSRKSARRKPELQFSVYEEHRCPYCLDEVKRNDPRGVKECSVCHALHHADCWNITGMCQVPHLNS